MKGMPRLYGFGSTYFAISCCLMFTGLVPASGQSRGDFSEVHFDGTFLILGQHILDTSDIGVILQQTNEHFQNLSKPNAKDLSWDSDGVRYAKDSKGMKITWVLAPDFLHSIDGHPTNVFKGKLSIFEIPLFRGTAIPEALLSKYGFEATGDHVPVYYQLEKNGWKINIITDRDRDPEAVTLEHSLSPD
jgi:hypothetical protein